MAEATSRPRAGRCGEPERLFGIAGAIIAVFLYGIRSILIFSIVTLTSCGEDSPDRLRPHIPEGISAGKTVYYNTKWFDCAVAIFEIQPKFLAELRVRGPDFLDQTTKLRWYSAPMPFDTNDRWIADFFGSLDCIADQRLRSLFQKASEKGGYYHIQSTNSALLIVPDAGLLMVGGYE